LHQQALDAAVLAGATLKSASDEERIAHAQKILAGNLKVSGLSTWAEPTVDNPSAAPVFTVQDSIVSGISTVRVSNYFSGFIGEETVDITLKAAAQWASTDPVCVLALDELSPQGIEIYGTSRFTARNCAAQANSGDGAGMRQHGGAFASARQFGVQGGYSGEFHPRPTTGVPPTADPYASVPFPQTGACVDIASKLMHTPAILEPGTYCGGIRIMANSEIIMLPGVYVMLDGPFAVDSNSTVTGSEVMIAFKGIDSSLDLGSGAIIELTSPVSGPYMNIQFLQDRNSSTDEWVTMLGDIKLTFDGVMYFPTQDVWIGGGSTIEAKSPSYIFVVEKLWVQDNAVIDIWQENSRGLEIAEQPASLSRNARLLY
jgi:hypothetical protein